jgi:hypothetical protein
MCAARLLCPQRQLSGALPGILCEKFALLACTICKIESNFEAGKLVPISDFVVGSLVRGLHFQLTAQLTEYSEWFINFIPKGGIVDKYWLWRT